MLSNFLLTLMFSLMSGKSFFRFSQQKISGQKPRLQLLTFFGNSIHKRGEYINSQNKNITQYFLHNTSIKIPKYVIRIFFLSMNFQVYTDEDTLRQFGRLTRVYAALAANYTRAAVRQNAAQHIPVMRPLFLMFEDDPQSFLQVISRTILVQFIFLF